MAGAGRDGRGSGGHRRPAHVGRGLLTDEIVEPAEEVLVGRAFVIRSFVVGGDLKQIQELGSGPIDAAEMLEKHKVMPHKLISPEGTLEIAPAIGFADVIADSIETVMCAQWYDANISIPGCDKNMPGCLMAMARVNRPALVVYGGTIRAGELDGAKLGGAILSGADLSGANLTMADFTGSDVTGTIFQATHLDRTTGIH